MGGLTRRVAATALGTALALAAGQGSIAPAVTRAESALWTMVASPLSATIGVATTFTLTVTNEDPLASVVSANEIGCIIVDVPLNFVVSGASVSGSSAGESWSAGVAGQLVKVRAGSGGDRLETLEWVGFTVGATAMSAGSLAWAARAYRDQSCGGTGSALGVPPIVIVSGPPVPTPTPKPSPTPSPTGPLPSLPLPTDPLPTVLPSVGPTSSPRPPGGLGIGGEAPSPTETPDPTSGGAGPQPPGGGDTDPAPVAPSGPEIRFEEVELDLGSQGLGKLGGIGVWAVPAAAIGTPGLLVLVWVLLQSIGAALWIPAARRLRTGSRPATR